MVLARLWRMDLRSLVSNGFANNTTRYGKNMYIHVVFDSAIRVCVLYCGCKLLRIVTIDFLGSQIWNNSYFRCFCCLLFFRTDWLWWTWEYINCMDLCYQFESYCWGFIVFRIILTLCLVYLVEVTSKYMYFFSTGFYS